MNKKKLASRAAEVLRQNNIRKSVPTQKAVLHVSDDDGNHSNFTIKKPGRGVLFNANDIEAVLDACLIVTEDALKRGEEVYLHGYGTIGLRYRAPRRVRIPSTGEWTDIEGHWLPHYDIGSRLKMAAKVYDMNAAGEDTEQEPEDIPDTFEEDEDGE